MAVSQEILYGDLCHLTLGNKYKDGNVVIISSKTTAHLALTNDVISQFESVRTRLVDTVKPNPTFRDIDSVFKSVREFDPNVIVAVGGGSVIDVSKIVSLMLSNNVFGAAENLLKFGAFNERNCSLVAIPTTCGTGSEVTPFATVWTDVGNGKVSIETTEMLPDLVLINGLFSMSASPNQLLYSGLDAISHCVETIWNRNRSKESVGIACKALQILLKNLPLITSDVKKPENFHEMQKAAMMAGKAIAINHTAIAHSISYSLTSRLNIPHGLACSFTIPVIAETYLDQMDLNKYERNCIADAASYLRSMNLGNLVLSQIEDGKVIEEFGSTEASERSKNFLLEMNSQEIDRILARSFRSE